MIGRTAIETSRDSIAEPAPVIADHVLVRCIGRGSYGQVWLGQSVMGVWRAIKVIYKGDGTVSGFEREFAGIRKFEPVSRNSTGLVHILQIGQDSAHRYFYYVMELADDGNCDEPWSFGHSPAIRGQINPDTFVPGTLALERRRRGRLPAPECVRIAIALSEALANLHERGLLHRDLKPSNIIFVKGYPKLADIGLVAEMSEANSYVGTEGYIAPEGPNSPQGDIYSLGKVLYEISTGKDRQDFPEPITLVEPEERTLLQELNAVVLRACAPQTAERYKTAREMLVELQLIERGGSIRSRRIHARRRRVFKWSVLAALGSIAVVAGWEKFLDARVRSVQGESSLIPTALAGKVRPRDSSAPHSTIDLSRYYTAPLNERWYPGPWENTLRSLPQGVQKFADSIFDVRGLVQLSGQEIRNLAQSDLYPAEVRGIGIHRWIKRLEFLQGAISEASEGVLIGRYELEFASGRTLEIPLRYGRDLSALWQPTDSSGTVSNAVVAWSGDNPATRERQISLRLYKQSWENPWPGDKVVQLSFFSTLKNSAPFLLALSAETLPAPVDAEAAQLDVVGELQKQRDSFPQLQLTTNASGILSPARLNSAAIQVGGIHFKGFRFKTPLDRGMDFVWAFAGSTNSRSHSWGIFPLNGRMKAGFEDWYHGSFNDRSEGFPFQVQHLSGKKLNGGEEYVIAFVSDQETMNEMKLTMRFVPSGDINPNKPETMLSALNLQELPELQGLKFHRHYCQGWWK